MNLKRIFGALLTIVGIVALIYGAYHFINMTGQSRGIRIMIMFGFLGLVFFVTGIGLVKNTKDAG